MAALGTPAVGASLSERMFWIGGAKPADLRSRSVEVPPDVRAIYLHRGAARQVVRLGVAPSISGAADDEAILAASEGYRSSEERARTPTDARRRRLSSASTAGTSSPGDDGHAPPPSHAQAALVGTSGPGHRRVHSSGHAIPASLPTTPPSHAATLDGAAMPANASAPVPVPAHANRAGHADGPDPSVASGLASLPPLVSPSADGHGSRWMRPISWSGSSFRLPWTSRVRQPSTSTTSDDESASTTRPVSTASSTTATTTTTTTTTTTATSGRTAAGAITRRSQSHSHGGGPETEALAVVPHDHHHHHHHHHQQPHQPATSAAGLARVRMSVLSRSHPDLPLPYPSDPHAAAPTATAGADAALAAAASAAAAAAAAEMAALEVEAPSGPDAEPADESLVSSSGVDRHACIREGELMVLRPDSHEWRRQIAVLSAASLGLFPLRGGAGHIVAMEAVTGINLRADTDNAIELTTAAGVYTLQADRRMVSEEWIHDILRTVPLSVITKVVPTHVSVDLPYDNATENVPASVTTTAEQLLQQLSLQRNTDYFRTWCLCLRRGDHLIWLEPDDLVITLPIVFKSHRLQCHRIVDRQHASAGAVRPPDVEGYMHKHGADNRLGGWKKRFFFTRDRDLFYAKAHNQRNGEPACTATDTVGVIPLEDVLAVDGDATNPDQFSITIVGRVYRLRAASPEDMVLWVASLRRLREYYQSVIANSYRKQMRWGSIPSVATTAKRQGFLHKRGQFNRSWKRRLVILVSGHLCYFTADEGAKHLRGKIPLAHATVALAPNENVAHAFQVITPERTFVLRAETQPELEQWMAAIDAEKQAALEASLDQLAMPESP